MTQILSPPLNPPVPEPLVLKKDDRVRLTQQTIMAGKPWSTTIEGTVVSFKQKRTGSWFAHSKDDRLWLDRLEIRRDDGELIVCNLDRISHIETVGGAPNADSGGRADDSAPPAGGDGQTSGSET